MSRVSIIPRATESKWLEAEIKVVKLTMGPGSKTPNMFMRESAIQRAKPMKKARINDVSMNV